MSAGYDAWMAGYLTIDQGRKTGQAQDARTIAYANSGR
jgi:hypothetical protein